jgi:hypothetical protein
MDFDFNPDKLSAGKKPAFPEGIERKNYYQEL